MASRGLLGRLEDLNARVAALITSCPRVTRKTLEEMQRRTTEAKEKLIQAGQHRKGGTLTREANQALEERDEKPFLAREDARA